MAIGARNTAPHQVQATNEELCVLPVSLLETQAVRVHEFLNLSKRLHVGLGWHYLLDLAWASKQVEDLVAGSKVLDAGRRHGSAAVVACQPGRGSD